MPTMRLKTVWMLMVGGLSLAMSAAAVGTEASSWLISDELLDHAQLTRVWQTTLPVRETERLDAMAVLEGRLYVRTSQNYAWSLNREDGHIVFGLSIARPGFPLLGWSVYGNRLISVIDNQIVEFDKDTGTRTRVSTPDMGIIVPPARNDGFFYISTGDRRLHALRAEDMVRLFQVSARNDSLITSVLADEDIVVMGTDAGNLIAMAAAAPRKLWQFDAAGAMAGPVIRDGRSYYFANKDTNVYRVDEVDENAASLIWKYQTEAILDRSPRVTGTTVYQYALNRGLSAIDKQSGQARWVLPEGIDLLAESYGRAYVITRSGTLAVMDNQAGKQLYWINLAGVVKHAANTTDALIYVADARGRVTCLRPVR